jgi:hypothetical protein
MIVNSPKRPLIVPTNVPFKRISNKYPYDGNGGLGGGGNNEYVSINPSVQASIMGDINPIFFLYYKSMGVAIIVVIFLIFLIF